MLPTKPATPVTRAFIDRPSSGLPSDRRLEEDLPHHAGGAQPGDRVGDLGPVQAAAPPGCRRPARRGRGRAPKPDTPCWTSPPVSLPSVTTGGRPGGHGLHQDPGEAFVARVRGHQEHAGPVADLSELRGRQPPTQRDAVGHVCGQRGDLLARGPAAACRTRRSAGSTARRDGRAPGGRRRETASCGVLRHLEPADPDHGERVGGLRPEAGDGGVEPGGGGDGARVPRAAPSPRSQG